MSLSNSVMEQIRTNAGFDNLAKPVIPLFPYLKARAHLTNDAVLNKSLDAMGGKKQLVPNTQEWCDYFGTVGPCLTDELTVDGRRLMSDDETVVETIEEPTGGDVA